MDIDQPVFWLALGQIMWVNVVLSGDNAVVIALACRTLPPKQRLWGMVLGSGVAIVLRIVFTWIVQELMALPYLKLVGGLLLFWIAVKLIASDSEGEAKVEAAENLWRAVWIVAIADIIMSLDNVIAIAAAAKGHTVLMIIGLGISIPLIVAGAALIMELFSRFPILVWAGAALLGWIAAEIIVEDPAVVSRIGEATAGRLVYWAAAAGAALVIAIGYAVVRRRRPAEKASDA